MNSRYERNSRRPGDDRGYFQITPRAGQMPAAVVANLISVYTRAAARTTLHDSVRTSAHRHNPDSVLRADPAAPPPPEPRPQSTQDGSPRLRRAPCARTPRRAPPAVDQSISALRRRPSRRCSVPRRAGPWPVSASQAPPGTDSHCPSRCASPLMGAGGTAADELGRSRR